jgi:hypothetical protein
MRLKHADERAAEAVRPAELESYGLVFELDNERTIGVFAGGRNELFDKLARLLRGANGRVALGVRASIEAEDHFSIRHAPSTIVTTYRSTRTRTGVPD